MATNHGRTGQEDGRPAEASPPSAARIGSSPRRRAPSSTDGSARDVDHTGPLGSPEARTHHAAFMLLTRNVWPLRERDLRRGGADPKSAVGMQPVAPSS